MNKMTAAAVGCLMLLLGTSIMNLSKCRAADGPDDEVIDLKPYIDSIYKASYNNFREFDLEEVIDPTKNMGIVFPYLNFSESWVEFKEKKDAKVSIVWSQPDKYYNDARGFYNYLRESVQKTLPYEYARKVVDHNYPGRRITYVHELEYTEYEDEHLYPLVEIRYIESPEMVQLLIIAPNPPDDYQKELKGEGFLNLLGEAVSSNMVNEHINYLRKQCHTRVNENMTTTTHEFLHKGINMQFKAVWTEHPRMFTNVIFDNGFYKDVGYQPHYGELPFGLNFLDGKAKVLETLEIKGNPMGKKLKNKYQEIHHSNVRGIEGLFCRLVFEDNYLAMMEFYILPNQEAIENWNKKKKKFKFAPTGL